MAATNGGGMRGQRPLDYIWAIRVCGSQTPQRAALRSKTLGFSMQPFRILYVEDNDDLRESISALMEADGREVLSLPNAEAALVAMADKRFDLLITDVSLPGISGIDLARRWLEPDATRWVLLCSGYDFRHGLASIGPNVRSLPKAFEPEALDSLLAEIKAAIKISERRSGLQNLAAVER